MKKPLILVTNDDGITAPGIRNLVSFMNEIGEVVVVAPNSPQSGKGHAITINSTLTYEEISMDGPQKDYALSGTPVDCIKFALDKILTRKPDLVVSGINHGANSSINVIYSGTMSAAVEAGVEGLQAIGFSLLDFSWEADFTQAKTFIQNIVNKVLENPLPKGVVLNVNIPKLPKEEIKGIKVCKQAHAKWEESFDERVSPHGKKYYWLTGYFNNMDQSPDADETALADGYISVVPVKFDLTAHEYLNELRNTLTS
ncbi:5'/3'-nucleotidase SurE [Elizabethkingia meningoseptica]|uniref:5'/3'-nucleotidase SurE n=1 Tax=Elizabethkingia meningoseptica TaxID=238 RepID=UPI000332BDB7|nr:5'/3'-nucleotidase SurE [Elizabethkingia meningoseptica]AQX04345.1 5'/3'-nucleotidase SurE [Elizabethkingia meningoseptica]AQX46387.1 5'/3'-nucleotidase SurE [Elizabethkingia meningoseptica]EOR30035.1 5'(3')-nucleotidase/polyphosphatase [Elizabethkingia meningoseptica ATCC 13253 = NBRC 12535]KUY18902.1 stationary phase survival protein SurE [Elizabethkingia meningoseptica]OPB73123.1 5'/3'-nucleotidase SurE [Elizabethkingia meningoseptica]